MHARIAGAGLALALAAGLAGAALSSAPALATAKPHATTVCFNSPQPCINISNLMLNQDNAPQFLLNATNGQKAIGRRLNLRQASDTRSNEDFVVREVGTLGQLCPSETNPVGVNSLDPTSYACLVYNHLPFGPNYPVYQGQFAPNSNESGLCVGALAATLGFKVRLVDCGSPRSFWVGDLGSTITVTHPGGSPATLVYFPLEFAADTSASNPLVATFIPDSKNPVNKVVLREENLSGGSAINTQMWTFSDQAGSTPSNR